MLYPTVRSIWTPQRHSQTTDGRRKVLACSRCLRTRRIVLPTRLIRGCYPSLSIPRVRQAPCLHPPATVRGHPTHCALTCPHCAEGHQTQHQGHRGHRQERVLHPGTFKRATEGNAPSPRPLYAPLREDRPPLDRGQNETIERNGSALCTLTRKGHRERITCPLPEGRTALLDEAIAPSARHPCLRGKLQKPNDRRHLRPDRRCLHNMDKHRGASGRNRDGFVRLFERRPISIERTLPSSREAFDPQSAIVQRNAENSLGLNL